QVAGPSDWRRRSRGLGQSRSQSPVIVRASIRSEAFVEGALARSSTFLRERVTLPKRDRTDGDSDGQAGARAILESPAQGGAEVRDLRCVAGEPLELWQPVALGLRPLGQLQNVLCVASSRAFELAEGCQFLQREGARDVGLTVVHGGVAW